MSDSSVKTYETLIDWSFTPEGGAFDTISTAVQAIATERREHVRKILELEHIIASGVPEGPPEAELLGIMGSADATPEVKDMAVDMLFARRHPALKLGGCIRDQKGRTYKLTAYEWKDGLAEFQVYGERWDPIDRRFTGYKSIIEWTRPVPDPSILT